MTTTLDYGRPGASTPERPPPRRPSPLLVAALLCGLVASVTCVRIEVLNRIAGNRLPNREEGKWAIASRTVAQQAWRRNEAVSTNDPTVITRPLTPPEQRRQDAHLRREEANAKLRGVVTTWGLAQYVLVPAGLVMAQLLAWADPRRLERRVGLVLTLVFACCGASVVGRAYFASLGW